MLNEKFTSWEFFLGLLATLFFAYLVSILMRWVVRKYEIFPAPDGIDQTTWNNAFNSPKGVLSNNRIIGFMEATSYFIIFSIGKPELIAGWLAFKVASKWQSWSTILKVPEKIEKTEQLAYIGAKNIVAAHTLQRWLIGNIANILAGLFGLMLGIWTTKLGERMDFFLNIFDHNLVLWNFMKEISTQNTFKTTFLYFYSTVAQSMAALFAISGIFLIFRLEMIKSEISRGIDNFRSWVAFRISINDPAIKDLEVNIEPHSWLEKDIRDHIEEALKKAQTKVPGYIKALTDYFNFINCRLNFQTGLKIFSCPPFILIAIVFLNAIYCLAKIDILSLEALYFSVIFMLFWICFIIIYLLIFIIAVR